MRILIDLLIILLLFGIVGGIEQGTIPFPF